MIKNPEIVCTVSGFFCTFAVPNLHTVMNEYYYYGLAATIYITTCWTFALVRWFHACNEPKDCQADQCLCGAAARLP